MERIDTVIIGAGQPGLHFPGLHFFCTTANPACCWAWEKTPET